MALMRNTLLARVLWCNVLNVHKAHPAVALPELEIMPSGTPVNHLSTP